MHLTWKSNQHLMLLSVYAPSVLADPAVKNSFYWDLSRHLNTPANDANMLIIDDYKAWVWRNSMAWKWVLCSHGVSKSCQRAPPARVRAWALIRHYKYNTTSERPPENNLFIHSLYLHPSEHIGRLARMSVLGAEVDGSNPAAVCCFFEQDTLSALLQSTQLWHEYQVWTTSWMMFSVMSFSEE